MEVAFAFAQARFGLRPRVESGSINGSQSAAVWMDENVVTPGVPVGIVRRLLSLFIP